MNRFNDDGNVVGRVAAVALLIAAGFGLRRLGIGAMCPVIKTDSCCAGGQGKQAASTAAPAPVLSVPEK
ncbi:MAG: hypothetical protein HY403_03840 [Elusimicrobia bacterium]|nr:hypothetical protein [Elusimicrobiota bacterium]